MDRRSAVEFVGQRVEGQPAGEAPARVRLLQKLDRVGVGPAELDDRPHDRISPGRYLDLLVGLPGYETAHRGRAPVDDDDDRRAGLCPQSVRHGVLGAEEYELGSDAPSGVHERRALHVEDVHRAGVAEPFTTDQRQIGIHPPERAERTVTGFGTAAGKQRL